MLHDDAEDAGPVAMDQSFKGIDVSAQDAPNDLRVDPFFLRGRFHRKRPCPRHPKTPPEDGAALSASLPFLSLVAPTGQKVT